MIGHRHAATLAAVLTLAFAAPAFAHAHLSSAVPAPDAAVKVAPDRLVLHFTEGVEPDFTELAITRDGADVHHGSVVIDPADPATVSVGFDAALVPGAYTITWRTVATDGHKSDGSYSFTVAP